MPKYRITIELSCEVDADSREEAQRLAETKLTEQRRTIEVISERDPQHWLPVGQ